MSVDKGYWIGRLQHVEPEKTLDNHGQISHVYLCPWCNSKYAIKWVVVVNGTNTELSAIESHQCPNNEGMRVHYLNEFCISGVGNWVSAEAPNRPQLGGGI